MESFTHGNQELKYKTLGDKTADTVVIWAHGWGHDHQALQKIAEPLAGECFHILIDFPGFGDSPIPSEVWGPEDYAEFTSVFIRSLKQRNVLWVGHSFGCRVGLHIGSRHSDLLSGMCLIAAAGLPRKCPFYKQLYFKFRIVLYKFMKKITQFGLSESWLKSKFGSADYKAAGAMQNILVKTVNENLSHVAPLVTCPVKLVFGSQDDQTPPEMGKRYHRLIPNSEFVLLEGYDHYSILGAGHHQLARIIKKLMRTYEKG